MITLISSYSETNKSTVSSVYSGVPNLGQSFLNTDGCVLDSCKFYLNKLGTTTGNVTAILYAHSGTFGTSSVPTGSPLATSDPVDITTLSTSLGLVTFNFSSAERIVLSASTYYCIVFNFTGGDFSNCVQGGIDTSAPSDAGNYLYYSSGAWHAQASWDVCFYVYGDILSSTLKSPGTCADDSAVGTVAWSDPDNAKVSDNVYSTAVGTNLFISHYLKATNFGFTIPTGSTINGVLVEVEKKGGTVGGDFIDSTIKLVKGGTVSGDNKSVGANWLTTDTYSSYGSMIDLWGLSLTTADVNSSDFGVVLTCMSTSSNSKTASVDHIRITVYYTEGTPSAGRLVATGRLTANNRLSSATRLVASNRLTV